MWVWSVVSQSDYVSHSEIMVPWTYNLCTLTKSSVYKAHYFSHIIKLTSYAASCIIELVTIIIVVVVR